MPLRREKENGGRQPTPIWLGLKAPAPGALLLAAGLAKLRLLFARKCAPQRCFRATAPMPRCALRTPCTFAEILQCGREF